MLDFLKICSKSSKRDEFDILPKFVVRSSSDLMIRGGDFYAIWNEDEQMWSTDEEVAIQLIDRELERYFEENKDHFLNCRVHVKYMWDSDSGSIDRWHKYCQKQMRDRYHNLDETLIFSNTSTDKKNYSSKKLNYPMAKGCTDAWDELVGVLYSPEEKHKIEWCIGSIVNGDSRHLQKFAVLYGSAGTGKSTVLNIIQDLFEGYYSTFDAKALGSSSNAFALESFRTNPLVAIQHDGDLSKIEDNTKLNSIVSHELMSVNEKFKGIYENSFKCFLFMGTNKPVKITDAKSGILRRLIDITPTGDKVSSRRYKELINAINFELGAIAYKCKDIYEQNPDYYDDYVPLSMMGSTNDFFNFIEDNYDIFKEENSVTLKSAWELYKTYCEYANIPYPFSQRLFKEELKNYFECFYERKLIGNERYRNYYENFLFHKVDGTKVEQIKEVLNEGWIQFDILDSKFDKLCKDCQAQYGNENGTPEKKWSNCKTTLKDISSKELHYVKVPLNHIVIDFDIPDEDGNKSLEQNLKEANKWPKTYAELSKSGAGIHLHYIYNGDVEKLSRLYGDHIEIKIFTGNSSLRRKLTKCNDIDINEITSGLPLKEEKAMVNFDSVKNEKSLRTLIIKNLKKEIHPATKPSMDFIKKLLDDAYDSGMHYDLSDLQPSVIAFAAGSTHQSEYCMTLATKMKFKSDDISEPGTKYKDEELVFYDVEVFPNLFLVNYKVKGKNKPVIRMINPTSGEIENLIKRKLVGFNCRRYDNHILYARLMGYPNQALYELSQRIINQESGCFFSEAYNLSYTDVYDFASAANKMSLKKFEIKLGIHHQELDLPWDQPVPEDMWTKVAEYCDNDVIATEAVFDYLSADWTARKILADLAGMTVNDTTNTLTTRIIFGTNRTPQNEFHYRDLSKPVHDLSKDIYDFLVEACPVMMSTKHGEEDSILPYFPGYSFEAGKSIYRGEEVGEGGYVYSEPGMYGDVALLDISSMHPHSTIAECLFGPKFTRAYRDIVEGRVSIKHEAWDIVNGMLEGRLTPHIQRVIDGEMTSGDLANALKTAINSVYGLTSAKFENPFKDKRNIDNIVAKRGALFMINLKHEVQARGYTVAHIKTDSIKIPDATPEIIQFVMDYGELYGYSFEHEATYEKMCLVNDAVYIAKYKDGKHAGEWTAIGTQFQVPYVFKKLFSHETIEFSDMCETKSVSKGTLYLDMNENLKEGEHDYRFIGKVGYFCPIKKGCNGGELFRVSDDKYYYAAGTKDYRWLEAEKVKELESYSNIDESYYKELCDDAIASISEYGDFNWFASDEKYERPPFVGGKMILKEND